MKIKMITIQAGPGVSRAQGHIYDVEEEEAKHLIDIGSAELIEESEQEAEQEAETAVEQDQGEENAAETKKTVSRKRIKKRGRRK